MVKKIANIDIDHIRASIPNDNIFLAYLIRRIIHSFSLPDNLYSEMSTFLYELKEILVSYISIFSTCICLSKFTCIDLLESNTIIKTIYC